MQESTDAVLDYWLGSAWHDADVIAECGAFWFTAEAQRDADISQRFSALVSDATRGELEQWAGEPRGRLALILLLDQFTRNIYRGTPAAFAHDHWALAHCLEAQSRGQDERLRIIERAFVYMPMQHAEALPVQEESVRCFERLASQAPVGTEADFERYLDFARRHRDIIYRFERFPHRNAILSRPSTPEEVEFLRQPDSSF